MKAPLRWICTFLCAAPLAGSLGCGGDDREPSPPAAETSRAAAPPAAETSRALPALPTVQLRELPDDFPSDVPVHPDATVTTATTQGPLGMSVNFAIEGRYEEVVSFYADSLATQGWSAETSDESLGKTIRASKQDRSLFALIRPREGGADVNLVLTQAR